jgi:hypothetical protein
MPLSEHHRQKMESLAVAAESFSDLAFDPFVAEYSEFKVLLDGGHQPLFNLLLAIAGVGTGYLLGGEELTAEDHRESALCLRDGLTDWPAGSYETLIDFFQTMVADLGEEESFHQAIGKWFFSQLEGKLEPSSKKTRAFLARSDLQEFVGAYILRSFQEFWEAKKSTKS